MVNTFNKLGKNMKKLGAVIIEDRKIGEFYKIVKEHIKYLPKDQESLFNGINNFYTNLVP